MMNKLKVLQSSQNHQRAQVARLVYEDDGSIIDLEKLIIREEWGSYVRFLMSWFIEFFFKMIYCDIFFYQIPNSQKKFTGFKRAIQFMEGLDDWIVHSSDLAISVRPERTDNLQIKDRKK